MARVAFINPAPCGEAIYGGLSSEASVLPPLGLCSVAAAARSKGHEVRIFDAQIPGLSNEGVVDAVIEWGTRYVGITATTDIALLAGELAGAIKSRNPRARVILGGPHISALPEETLRSFPGVDFGVVGEGEETLRDLVGVLESGGDPADVPGLVHRPQGRIEITPPRGFIKDLDVLPLPAWDLLPDLGRSYRPTVANVKSLPAASLVTSRGCPGKCAFCDTRVFGSSYRMHSARYVLDAIRHLKQRYGIRGICFYDDVFTIFKSRLGEICAGLREPSSRVDWSCQAMVNAVDFETMRMMRNAGCWKISFGIESGSEEVLRLMRKNLRLDRARQAISDAKRAGLQVEGYFIVGFFGETAETLRATERFIMESDLDLAILSYFIPFPGSPAYAQVREYGSFDEDWDNMNALDPDRPLFVPRGLTSEALVAATKRIYRRFYFRPKTFVREAWKALTDPAYALRASRAAWRLGRSLFGGTRGWNFV